MITLSQAKRMLQEPERIPGLLDAMEQMSSQDLDALSPLVFDVIDMKDRSLSLPTLKRLTALRPGWVNQENQDFGLRPSPLILAVKNVCLETVSFLLDAGASAHTTDARGLDALDHVALQDFNPPGLDLICVALIEKGGVTQAQKDLALYHAADNGNLAVVKTLLSHGADFTKTTQKGTALGAACFLPEFARPVVEIVKAMLQTDRGRQVIDWGWHHPDEGYGAPIHCAARRGSMGVLSVLVEAGASVNPPSEHAQSLPPTPLMSAATGVKPDVIDFLIRAGADATLTNASGCNALHLLALMADNFIPAIDGKQAQQSLIAQTVAMLTDAGADLSMRNNEGHTPHEVARESGDIWLADYLAAIASRKGLKSTTHAAHSPSARSGPRL